MAPTCTQSETSVLHIPLVEHSVEQLVAYRERASALLPLMACWHGAAGSVVVVKVVAAQHGFSTCPKARLPYWSVYKAVLAVTYGTRRAASVSLCQREVRSKRSCGPLSL